MGTPPVVFGLLQCAVAIQRSGWWWLAAWSGVSFTVLGAAYLVSEPLLLGKRPDGRIHPAALLLLLPYFLYTWGVWHVFRWSTRERPFDEVAPGLLLGRRPLAGELPASVELVVDLTAEFRAARRALGSRAYICIPTLDATAPRLQPLLSAARRAAASQAPVYVHCALGHGRSATLAAAVLLLRGSAASTADALATMRRVRPGVGLHEDQLALLRRLETELSAGSIGPH